MALVVAALAWLNPTRTMRPDELDPDVKSRAPLQIPILDPEGEARQRFLQELFQRRFLCVAQVIPPRQGLRIDTPPGRPASPQPMRRVPVHLPDASRAIE